MKSQIIAKELKLNKQNTDPHSPKWISVNFLFDPLNLEQEKVEKSLQITHSGLLSPVVQRYRIYLTAIIHLTSKT